jgi:hypothetical protein
MRCNNIECPNLFRQGLIADICVPKMFFEISQFLKR